jgi:dimethylamine corrinoid protein
LATLDALRGALIELDEGLTLDLTRELMAEGQTTPESILTSCQQALKVVGERYEREEYFISGLIMAGELFKEVLEIVQPSKEQMPRTESRATIVLGTVAKDIHDIGKNLFGMALRGAGFEVIDLGVDVPADRFLTETLRHRPQVVCLSGLIFMSFESMKETVALLRAHEERLGYRVPIVIGGGIIDGRVCEFAGADSWSTDSTEGVRICEKLVSASGSWPAPLYHK